MKDERLEKDLALARAAMAHRDVVLDDEASARAWAALQRAVDHPEEASAPFARVDRVRTWLASALATWRAEPARSRRLAVLGAGLAAGALGVALSMPRDVRAPVELAMPMPSEPAPRGAGSGVPLNGIVEASTAAHEGSMEQVSLEPATMLLEPATNTAEAPWATWRTPPATLELEPPPRLATRIERALEASRSGASGQDGIKETDASGASANGARDASAKDESSKLANRAKDATASGWDGARSDESRLDDAERWVASDAPRARAMAEAVLDGRPPGELEVRAQMVIADALRREGDLLRAAATYGVVAESPWAGPFLEEALLREAQLLAELGRGVEATRVLDEADARVPGGLLGPERRALRGRLSGGGARSVRDAPDGGRHESTK